ncbi:MAG: aldo/keto reductase [Francisellaceae bacterium]|nr:aldo/keto reductase [Francisellaceae bacterium]MBT6207386.1 aldo/keto reductase [Francisellaceae bacterium]MBT6539361.1 aldo/keto reductase [Francisellaceae bacterium]
MLLKRQLGSTDIKVSELGLGTVKLGRNTKVKYPDNFSIPNDQQALKLLSTAAELGINLLDTAPAYGNSEERLGNLLKGQRHNWILCSKVGEEFINNESTYLYNHAHIKKSIERSLQRLNTDYIDIMLIHSNGNDEDIIQSGALEILNDFKNKGYIRATGMSTKTISGGIMTIEQADIAMITYNPWYTDEKPVINKAKDLNKGILIKKAFNSGNFDNNTEPNPIAHSLNFILQEPIVSSIIIGSINPEHLIHNIQNIT